MGLRQGRNIEGITPAPVSDPGSIPLHPGRDSNPNRPRRWSPAPNLMEEVMRIHSGHTKHAILAAATIMILMAAGPAHPALAGTIYTNSVLNGCYAHRNTSVDTQLGAKNRSEVGTTCFDGLGDVIDTTAGDESGSCSNTNGVPNCSAGTSVSHGSYSITNFPGSGMGTVSFYQGTSLCQVNEISIDNVQGHRSGFSVHRDGEVCRRRLCQPEFIAEGDGRRRDLSGPISDIGSQRTHDQTRAPRTRASGALVCRWSPIEMATATTFSLEADVSHERGVWSGRGSPCCSRSSATSQPISTRLNMWRSTTT